MRSTLGTVVTSIQATSGRISSGIHSYFSLRKENERLERENFQMMKYVLEHESERRFASAAQGNYNCIRATIIRNSVGKQHNTFIIDRGSNDLVEEGDGVITANGVVGIVEMTTPDFSRVISFTNYMMAVSARLRSNGPTAKLVWDGISPIGGRLEEIPIHIPISQGDTVYTSGFSAVFPPDIPLGLVKGKVVVKGSYANARIELFEDFSKIRNVTVVKNLDKTSIEEASL